jgi:molybdopterin-guanine dinucleotide biosynthesis protein A
LGERIVVPRAPLALAAFRGWELSRGAPNGARDMLRAVITAGGRADATLAAAIGTPVKALAPFGAGVLLDVVLNAIAGAGIAQVAVVGDAEVARRLPSGVRHIPAAAEGTTNVARALDAWPDGDLLFAASDLPFVDGSALRAYLDASAAYDLTLPLAGAAAYEAAYPGAPPHLTTLGGERVANGSVFFIRSAAREPVRTVAGRFFEARKSALGMARLLGAGLLLRFVSGQLRIAHVERHAAQRLGVRAAAIRGAAPGLCFDVDTLADYRYACDPR